MLSTAARNMWSGARPCAPTCRHPVRAHGGAPDHSHTLHAQVIGEEGEISFGLVTYASGDGPRLGVLVGERIAPAEPALAPLLGPHPRMLVVLARWDEARPLLVDVAGMAAHVTTGLLPLAETRLLAPLPRPVNIYCAFANYVDHMKEMGGTPADKSVEDPFLFLTPVTAVTGPEQPIVIPAKGTSTDYEGELAA